MSKDILENLEEIRQTRENNSKILDEFYELPVEIFELIATKVLESRDFEIPEKNFLVCLITNFILDDTERSLLS